MNGEPGLITCAYGRFESCLERVALHCAQCVLLQFPMMASRSVYPFVSRSPLFGSKGYTCIGRIIDQDVMDVLKVVALRTRTCV